MTGAMYAGVAGLKTHMQALNVIGNNVANVNTDAYKAKRYVFSEALYTSVHSGSDGTQILGGRNPAQIGYGVSVGSIDLDMSTKAYHPTGLLMDCMIDGDGFFLVGDKSKNGVNTQDSLNGMTLSRLGNFQFIDGYLVDGEGQVVYGFLNVEKPADTTAGTPAGHEPVPVLTPIRLPKMFEKKNTLPDGTVETKINVVYPVTQADADGRTEVITNKTYDSVPADMKTDAAAAAAATGKDVKDEMPWVVLENLSVESNGRIVGTTDDDQQIIVGYVALGKVDNPNGVTHVDGHYYKALGGAGQVHLCSPGGAVQFVPGATTTTTTPPATGGGTDEVTSEVVVASAGDTTLINGGLEMPGTDLATEISNMICIQRGYQANTRIVTVTDSMLEELVNMKRG